MASKTINIDNIDFLLMDAVTGPREEFLKNFLDAYSFAKSTYKRLQTNGPDKDGYYSVKQKMLYKELAEDADMEEAYFDAIAHAKAKERFVIINNFDRVMAKDMMSDKGIDVPFDELPDSYEFFLPWTGREITDTLVENPADVKAAAKMGHLFESIIKDNEEMDKEVLNVFLTRILFCYFADDTGIFENDQFINSIINNTDEDGTDLGEFLTRLFAVLDIKESERNDINACFKHFPYVNGGLFREHYAVPRFTRTSRKKLIEGGSLNWAEINPDIFGSMFQTVIDPQQRRHLGQHYTSVPNIMKVLNPLFLDELHAELDKIGQLPVSLNRDKKLQAFRDKLARIKVFDPACGSGNFLIIAYKELCELEMQAISMFEQKVLAFLSISLDHFYGIEVDDFPCEVARLSLWLTQHQMNLECKDKFNECNPTLPLTETGHIVCGNALRLDWNEVCTVNNGDIVFCCGNPPYVGYKNMTEENVIDKEYIFTDILKYKPNSFSHWDYVTCWFYLAAKYMNCHSEIKTAFVTTSSINQGVQISLWPYIFKMDVEIFFAYTPFLWTNNATDKAGVTVTVVGLQRCSDKMKYKYDGTLRQQTYHIGPYLIPNTQNTVVIRASTPMFRIPSISYGTMFADGGNLIFSTEEKNEILSKYPESGAYFKKLLGAEEFINAKERWCIWVTAENSKEASKIPPFSERFEAVRVMRTASKNKDTRDLAEQPWRPFFIAYKGTSSIIIPRVSSSARTYIPMGYLDSNTIISDSAFSVENAPIWLFSLLMSKLHMIWVKVVGGKLKSDYRYSNALCYNTFPVPDLSEKQRERLEESAMMILEARENHYDMSNAELYNDATMPDDLRAAHEANDLLVDSLYKRTSFKNDEERLAELFRRYELMVKEGR